MPDQGTPFASYSAEVRPEWVDYNGHMHDASYAAVFSDANEVWFELLDLSVDYRRTAGASFYTVETHLRFLAELVLSEKITAETIVVSADPKRIRLHTSLFGGDGTLAATGESLYVHVDGAVGRSTPMPDDRNRRVQEFVAAHADLPRPAHLGLGVGAPRPRTDAS